MDCESVEREVPRLSNSVEWSVEQRARCLSSSAAVAYMIVQRLAQPRSVDSANVRQCPSSRVEGRSAEQLAPCLNSVGVDCMIVQPLAQPRTADNANVVRLVQRSRVECTRMEHVARWAVWDLDEVFVIDTRLIVSALHRRNRGAKAVGSLRATLGNEVRSDATNDFYKSP